MLRLPLFIYAEPTMTTKSRNYVTQRTFLSKKPITVIEFNNKSHHQRHKKDCNFASAIFAYTYI